MKIFHHTDLDGKAAAAILTRKFPDAQLIPYNYFYSPETTILRLEDGEEAIFVDITPTLDNLDILLTRTENVTIIDHHSSSLNDLESMKYTFDGIQHCDGIGACVLVWKYYFPDIPVPEGIQLLGEYDDWKRTPDNKRFQFGIQTFNTFPTNNIWDKILRDEKHTIMKIKDIGANVLSYIVPWYKRLVRSYGIIGTCDERYSTFLINQPGADSSVFDDVEGSFEIHLRVAYGKVCRWLVSITTDRDDIDVSEIARKYGGGGHRKSAGCSVEDLSEIFIAQEEVNPRYVKPTDVVITVF